MTPQNWRKNSAIGIGGEFLCHKIKMSRKYKVSDNEKLYTVNFTEAQKK